MVGTPLDSLQPCTHFPPDHLVQPLHVRGHMHEKIVHVCDHKRQRLRHAALVVSAHALHEVCRKCLLQLANHLVVLADFCTGPRIWVGVPYQWRPNMCGAGWLGLVGDDVMVWPSRTAFCSA